MIMCNHMKDQSSLRWLSRKFNLDSAAKGFGGLEVAGLAFSRDINKA